MRYSNLREEQAVQGHGIHVLAVLVDTHIAGGNLVDQHHATLGIVAELKLDVVQLHTLGGQIVGNDLGDLLGHILQILVLLVGHHADGNQSVLGDQGIALLVVLQSGLNVGGQVSAGLDQSAVAADEGTHSLIAADNLQTLAEHLGGQNLHGGILQVGGDVVGQDTGGIDLLKEIDGHTQVDVAHTLDGQTHGVLAGIEDAVLAGAVVLKLQQAVAVLQLVNVLSLAGVNQFPSTAPMVQKISEKGIGIISEIEFAGRYDSAKKVCITGSNGKTTTTSLVYHLLKQAGMNVGLGGNIGKSYALQVATEDYDIYVLELSSFQLDNVYDFKADIAIITNITPDHLDRYGHNMENYVKAKFRITRNMSSEDCFIFCSDDEITIRHLDQIVLKAQKLPFTQKEEVAQGAFVKEDRMIVRYKEEECDMYLQELALGGKHNVYNSMAAALAAKVMDIDNEAIRSGLATFQAVEHRLENVLSIRDVLYINDSKATNVDAAWYALECQTRPVVWIVGGTDKGNDYESLIPLAQEKVKAMICMGLDNKKFHESFEGIVPEIHDVASAQDAVKLAHSLAVSGDVVLLSPCCASFDLFKNYEDRGRQFKEAVRNL